MRILGSNVRLLFEKNSDPKMAGPAGAVNSFFVVMALRGS